MRKSYIFLTFLLLCLTTSFAAFSQEKDKEDVGSSEFSQWSVAINAGANVFDGDVSQTYNNAFPKGILNMALGATVERSFNPRYGLFLQYLYLPISGIDPGLNFKGKVNTANVGLSSNLSNIFYRNRTSRWNVYFNIGLGMDFYNSTSTLNSTVPMHEQKVEDGRAIIYPFGLNFEYNISKSIALSWETEYRMSNKDNFEANKYIQGNSNDAVLVSMLGVRYKFNAIESKHVRNIAMIDFEPEKALPLVQNIAKKVDDLEQKLKDAEEKLDHTKNKVDSLNPRVDNIEELLAKQFGGPDSDGDGVPDSRDREPNTPPGSYVNYWGQALPKEYIGSSRVMSVYFEYNKYELSPNSLVTIREVAIKMVKDPTLKVEVRGFCDYTGTDKYNLILSTRRALKVRRELINIYAIDESRIIANGQGKLVEPKNKYPLNRRCDFFFDK
jgi:OOP family OmpA-OmpF porin